MVEMREKTIFGDDDVARGCGGEKQVTTDDRDDDDKKEGIPEHNCCCRRRHRKPDVKGRGTLKRKMYLA